jgi:hypothetical protein
MLLLRNEADVKRKEERREIDKLASDEASSACKD